MGAISLFNDFSSHSPLSLCVNLITWLSEDKTFSEVCSTFFLKFLLRDHSGRQHLLNSFHVPVTLLAFMCFNSFVNTSSQLILYTNDNQLRPQFYFHTQTFVSSLGISTRYSSGPSIIWYPKWDSSTSLKTFPSSFSIKLEMIITTTYLTYNSLQSSFSHLHLHLINFSANLIHTDYKKDFGSVLPCFSYHTVLLDYFHSPIKVSPISIKSFLHKSNFPFILMSSLFCLKIFHGSPSHTIQEFPIQTVCRRIPIHAHLVLG